MQTDTASVLHEAMGYIKFLHDQVHVLCSPYLQRQNQSQSPSLRVSTFILTNSLSLKSPLDMFQISRFYINFIFKNLKISYAISQSNLNDLTLGSAIILYTSYWYNSSFLICLGVEFGNFPGFSNKMKLF